MGASSDWEASPPGDVALVEIPRQSPRSVDKQLAQDAQLGQAFQRKVTLVNDEIERMGWGKFHTWLFLQVAYGWAVDNIVFECVALSLTQIQMEMHPKHVQFATLFFYLGTLIGATFWGFTADLIGRRISWNLTLLLTFVFGLACAGAPNFVTYCALLLCMGLGTGGNVIIDGTQFIEANAGRHQWLVTVLAFFWTLGQIFAALVGWALIPHFSCAQAELCTKGQNMGWRYTWIVCSGVSFVFWILRFFVYPIPESPKFLLAQGDDTAALTVLRFMAQENNSSCHLTLADLISIDSEEKQAQKASDEKQISLEGVTSSEMRSPTDDPTLTLTGATLRKMAVGNWQDTIQLLSPKRLHRSIRLATGGWSLGKFQALFANPRMAWNTIDVMLLWTTIAFGSSLFNALISLYVKAADGQTGHYSVGEQYAQLLYIALAGAPGTVIAGLMSEIRWLGRKGSMALWTMLTGVLLFGFTTARTPHAVLGWSAGSSVTQNAMWAVLYTISYELFPTPMRGTGGGLSMGVQRIGGVLAPLVAIYTDNYLVPVMVSAALFLLASILMLLLPYETRGRTAL